MPIAPPSFELFSVSHLFVLALTLLLPALTISWVKWKPASARAVEVLYFLLLFLTKITALTLSIREGFLPWQEMLPFHVCDIATLAALGALGFRWRPGFVLAFYWGIAGTLQGVLTPDLPVGWPHPRFVLFFLSHSGLVAANLHLLFAGPWRLHFRDAAAAFLSLLIYAALMSAINFMLGTNYGYLCAKPRGASLLDHLGPWPWYIGSLMLICVLFFLAVHLLAAFGGKFNRAANLSQNAEGSPANAPREDQ